MGFKDLEIKREYRSLLSNVVDSFYTPVLSRAVLYRRAVGFFSSSALISLTEGIGGLITNGGRIELIASPRLSEEDLAAIRDGYERKDIIVRDCLLRELKEPAGRFEEARLNFLSNLIAAGILELKIALLESGNEIGMFHEKLGLVYDGQGNVIAFSGSMNESANAFYKNYESIDVYTSWGTDEERVSDKQSAFSAMWGDYEPGIKVFEFPELSDAIVKKYQITNGVNLSDLEIQAIPLCQNKIATSIENTARVPSWFSIRKYQKQAIDEWVSRSYCGIFDMATGTGKTYTALAAIATLSEALDDNLAVVIVCPYQHLVEQWKGDIVAFGMRPIVCHSASKQKNWKNRVKTSVSAFRAGAINGFCLVTTNATFSSDFIQEQISKLKGNCLIVVDEAHNFGASKLNATLPPNFPYRLALSATIDRYGDEEGTSKLYSYFGEKCIEYTLEDAINNGMLTPYYYYPIVVCLRENELDEYLTISKKIGQAIAASGSCSPSNLPDSVKMLLIKRARIVAGANNKIPALREAILPFAHDSHILVYCGATTIRDSDYIEGNPNPDEARQIDIVSDLLGNDLGMHVSQFTSSESAEKREVLKKEFDEAKQMQALVAIRCLDEGVNIPSIEKAFILASSTNPKEYIQRRGRVLRLSRGKKHADIYDFITVPVMPEDAAGFSPKTIASMKSLPAREVARMRDFARISENPTDSIELISELVQAFGITPDDEEGSYV